LEHSITEALKEQRKMKRALFVLSILVLASLACGALTGEPAPQPAPVDPGQPAEPAAPASNVLYQDDFSNPLSGWPGAADTDKAASYTDGGYLMQAFTASQDVWAHPGGRCEHRGGCYQVQRPRQQ
jgi:hypothetical protein